MEKISPLRASLRAFEQFKTQRRAQTNKQESRPIGTTNPFGLTFKGSVVFMDVFESQKSKAENSNSSSGIKESFNKAGKLASSAWVATKNKFDTVRRSIISFGSKLKQDTVKAWNKLNNTNISFEGLFSDSVSNLQKRPVNELEDMLKSELETVQVG